MMAVIMTISMLLQDLPTFNRAGSQYEMDLNSKQPQCCCVVTTCYPNQPQSLTDTIESHPQLGRKTSYLGLFLKSLKSCSACRDVQSLKSFLNVFSITLSSNCNLSYSPIKCSTCCFVSWRVWLETCWREMSTGKIIAVGKLTRCAGLAESSSKSRHDLLVGQGSSREVFCFILYCQSAVLLNSYQRMCIGQFEIHTLITTETHGLSYDLPSLKSRGLKMKFDLKNLSCAQEVRLRCVQPAWMEDWFLPHLCCSLLLQHSVQLILSVLQLLLQQHRVPQPQHL